MKPINFWDTKASHFTIRTGWCNCSKCGSGMTETIKLVFCSIEGNLTWWKSAIYTCRGCGYQTEPINRQATKQDFKE